MRSFVLYYLNGLQQPFLRLVAKLPKAVGEADLDGLRVGGLDDVEPVLSGQEDGMGRRGEARGQRRRSRRCRQRFDRNEGAHLRRAVVNVITILFLVVAAKSKLNSLNLTTIFCLA